MSWSTTHRRWQALREIEILANAGPDGEHPALPWNDEYAELFGDRDGLVAALRYRFRQTRIAQLDSHLPEHVLEERRADLDARQAGVLRLLQAWEGDPVPA